VSESRSDRQAAEFTRRASLAVTDTSTQVSYAIFQSPDRPWFLLDVLRLLSGRPLVVEEGRPVADASTLATATAKADVADVAPASAHFVTGSAKVGDLSASGPWAETLSSAGYGTGTVIVTTRGSREIVPELLVEDAKSASAGFVERPFQASATPNPSFLYRGARNVELAIHFPVATDRFDVADGVALATTIAHVARAAKRAQSPITFLQVPTSSPPRHASLVGSGASEEASDETTTLDWQPARSHGVRFAVALPADEPSKRFDFFEDVASLAATSGGQVWIADHRGDRRGGIWLPVGSPAESRYSNWAHGLVEEPVSDITAVCPVTFVGPARVGTTFEVAQYLSENRIPVVAATVGVLKDLAFIHLGIGLLKGSSSRVEGSAREILAGLTELFGRNSSEPVLDKAADYLGYRGEDTRLVLKPPGEGSRSVWAAWQLPFRDDALLTALESLRATLRFVLDTHRPGVLDPESLLSKTNIEYIVCRRVETGELKGRCKLALPPGYAAGFPGADRARTMLCRAVEEHWRTDLAAQLNSSAVEVEFTWRERWLGRWSSLLAGSMT
jgi:hypothetical protein